MASLVVIPTISIKDILLSCCNKGYLTPEERELRKRNKDFLNKCIVDTMLDFTCNPRFLF